MADRIFSVAGRVVEFYDGCGWNSCDDATCPGPVREQIAARICDTPVCDHFECITGVVYRWYPSSSRVAAIMGPLRPLVLPVLAGLVLGVALAAAVSYWAARLANNSADPRCAQGWRGWVEVHKLDAGKDTVTCEFRPEVGDEIQ